MSILFSICSLFGSVKGMIFCAILLVVFSISIWLQPESKAFLNFKVLFLSKLLLTVFISGSFDPLRPCCQCSRKCLFDGFPALGNLGQAHLLARRLILANFNSPFKTKFTAGYAIYFGYGWQHSSENPDYKKNFSEKSLEEMVNAFLS